MEQDVLFEEVQQFSKNSIRLILIIFTGVMLALSAMSMFREATDQEEVTISLITGTLICGLVNLLLAQSRMITQVRSDGIYVRYPPLMGRFSRYSWDEIDKAFIRQYQPLQEYGGWGIRISPNGRAFNVSGNTGLQLILRNGAKVLIGTQNPEALALVLDRIGKL